jgi:hypothetical protein
MYHTDHFYSTVSPGTESRSRHCQKCTTGAGAKGAGDVRNVQEEAEGIYAEYVHLNT